MKKFVIASILIMCSVASMSAQDYQIMRRSQKFVIDRDSANQGAGYPGGAIVVDSTVAVGMGITDTTAAQGALFVPTSQAQNDITAGTGGAIPVSNYSTTINTDGDGDSFTLANGVINGQLKKIRLVVDGGGSATITPTNFYETRITMDDAGDWVVLVWDASEGLWYVIENNGATVN